MQLSLFRSWNSIRNACMWGNFEWQKATKMYSWFLFMFKGDIAGCNFFLNTLGLVIASSYIKILTQHSGYKYEFRHQSSATLGQIMMEAL